MQECSGEALGRRLRRTTRALFLVLAVALLPATVRGQTMCFRQKYSWLGPPTIDGLVADDASWTTATRYVFSNGSSYPHAAIQVLLGNGNVYLSFEVQNDQFMDEDDAIVIAFQLPGQQKPYRKLLIYPASNDIPGTVATFYYKSDAVDANGDGWGGDVLGTSLLASTLKVASRQLDSTGSNWAVEVSLPMTGEINLSPYIGTNKFGFYANIVRTITSAATAAEFPWPPGGPEMWIKHTELQLRTPAPSLWAANASIAETCTGGISVDTGDIYVNSPGSTMIQLADNVFHANVHNDGPDAEKIKWRFAMKHFGITGSTWETVQGSPPGAWYPHDAMPQGGRIVNSNHTGAFSNAYADINYCILFEMDQDESATTNANFMRKSAINNMVFVHGSRTVQKATIDARGFAAPPAGKMQRFLLQPVPRPRLAVASGEVATIPRGQVVAQLHYPVHGYRLMYDYVIIKGKTFQLLEPTASFETIVQHPLVGQIVIPRPPKIPTAPPIVSGPRPGLSPIAGSLAARLEAHGAAAVRAPVFAELPVKDWGFKWKGATLVTATGIPRGWLVVDVDPQGQAELMSTIEYGLR